MGACEDELKMLSEELANGNIDVKEYSKRLRDIEREGQHPIPPADL